jgi:hypothetical protein
MSKEHDDFLKFIEKQSQIKAELAKATIQEVVAYDQNAQRLFMENILGTTKYLCHNRTTLYDCTFQRIYYYDKRVPSNCIVVNGMVLKIVTQADFTEPEVFLNLLNTKHEVGTGIRFYLDDVLYKTCVSMVSCDSLRDKLFLRRRQGKISFSNLKIYDAVNNCTEFRSMKVW